MAQPKLLITGHSGLIGGILWQGLSESFELYGADDRQGRQTDRAFRADISDSEQVNAVFERIPGLVYVVHLAAQPRVDADWQSNMMINIAGTKNLYEAAQSHGIKRVVFASSAHVTGAYEGFPPRLHIQPNPTLITTRHPIRPDSYYGVSKVAGEALARMYYELYGLESVCLRIGTVIKDDDRIRDAGSWKRWLSYREIRRSVKMSLLPKGDFRKTSTRILSTWLSHRDLIQLVRKSLLADVGFGIYYGVSNNRNRFWDISDAMAEIGYQPEDDASAPKKLSGMSQVLQSMHR